MVKMFRLEANQHTPDDWRAILREYQKQAIDVVYAHPEGVVSRSVWSSVNTLIHPASISRASIINFLNKCVDYKLIGYDERTGKGGYHRLYKPIMTWSEFEEVVIWRFIEKLMLIFPEKEITHNKPERIKIQV